MRAGGGGDAADATLFDTVNRRWEVRRHRGHRCALHACGALETEC